jgi:hypothetical protein
MKLHQNNNSTISGTIKSSNDNLIGTMKLPAYLLEALSLKKAYEALTKNKEEIIYDTTISMDSMAKYFTILGKTERQKMIDSEKGEDLIFKSKKYGIPFNPNIDDFTILAEQVMDYEEEDQISLSKANEYNIPYNEYDTDFIKLMDDIAEWEWLLKRAKNIGVEWDASNYNVTNLESIINENEYSSLESEHLHHLECSISRM